jgi:3-methylcrotonyl-CoA carboxylase alpha subunit/geranyl-CoA carboxylase alpha subunit
VFDREPGALRCRFALPLRLRHRERMLNRSLSTPEAGALSVADDGALRIAFGDGVTHTLHAVRVPAPDDAPRRHMQCGAVDWWIDDLSFAPPAAGAAQAASELRAPFNGKVVRVAAQPGQTLAAGDTALVIESMKLEHSLAARADATVAEVLVAEGQQVAPGQLLLRFAAA